MISKFHYDHNIPDEHIPEMKRAPLDKIILDTKLLGDFGTPRTLLACAMDPPNLQNIFK
jgi:HrpA-like RNA helicase